MEFVIIGLLAVVVILLIILLVRKNDSAATAVRDENASMRMEMTQKLGIMENNLVTRVENASKAQNEQLNTITKNNNDAIRHLNETVEKKLAQMQENNEKKLEQMRATVDEKLHKTLETRLSESFKTVSERLEQVHKGLGEMQNLAQGVGDLKKVMSNVKTRGILGELQLSSILEQIIPPSQYEKNIATKPGSRDVVEYAIKLPGKDDHPVYIPVDAKFPIEAYNRLLDAYDAADTNAVAVASKEIETAIKKSAKDIHEKYIYPPNTTDFGIMFLPVEGLYAEVVRNTALFETLQNEYKILVAGPTTLSALLTSLQMGFKTVAIEKRASEVWNVLGAVKTEFVKFSEVLDKAQKKINQASNDMDKLVGARTKKIMVQLNKIEQVDDVILLDEGDDEPEEMAEEE
ncbi:MAG: DNA recombination protein RmuC [Clostridia bacterium]|nr:DNA recombination protein RmuC [Clostridia bacterium]